MSFNFGTPKTASGFTLPTTSTTTPITGGAGDASKTQPKPSLFGTVAPTAGTGINLVGTPNTGITFGTPTTVTGAPNLSFGTPSTQTGAFSLSSTPKTTAALSFGAVTPTSSKLTFPATTISSTAPQFNLGGATTSSSFTPILGTSAPTLGTGLTTITSSLKVAPTTTSGFSLGTVASSTAPTTAVTSATTLAPTSTSSAIPAVGSLTYAQLEDSINKWTIDLEEQGKFFINQAKQLNAWDSLLISNGDKILNLNETIERVKQQQKQLDQELDFILAQQNELDELSIPLEKQLSDIPITDQNRFQMYQTSEIIDSQLKQMSEDLKEIIEHLNESNRIEDISDPIVQISRILNAHMNSLQWVDKNASLISSQIEQINKMQEVNKKNDNF